MVRESKAVFWAVLCFLALAGSLVWIFGAEGRGAEMRGLEAGAATAATVEPGGGEPQDYRLASHEGSGVGAERVASKGPGVRGEAAEVDVGLEERDVEHIVGDPEVVKAFARSMESWPLRPRLETRRLFRSGTKTLEEVYDELAENVVLLGIGAHVEDAAERCRDHLDELAYEVEQLDRAARAVASDKAWRGDYYAAPGGEGGTRGEWSKPSDAVMFVDAYGADGYRRVLSVTPGDSATLDAPLEAVFAAADRYESVFRAYCGL
jgi:hypothetical protein